MPTPRNAVREASDNRVFHILARSGFAVNGLIHILIGGIAIGVAVAGGSGGEADQSGALQGLAETPGGIVVLWLSVIGLFALALWQFVQAVLVIDRDTRKKWGRRAVEAGKGVVYVAIGSTALVFALGGHTDASETSRTLSARLLATPGGVVLLVAVGLTVFGFGVGYVSIGVRRTFRKLIDTPPGPAGRGVTVLGMAGYISMGIALGVVGILFVVAAIAVDPERASGLDGALKALADLPFGIAILIAVGAGLIAYGLYLVARSRLARL
jgi:hypothetical protein